MGSFGGAMLIQGLLGGLMIGIAAALMLLGNGRIAGVSGLAARATNLATSGTPRMVAIAFVIGLPLGNGGRLQHVLLEEGDSLEI